MRPLRRHPSAVLVELLVAISCACPGCGNGGGGEKGAPASVAVVAGSTVIAPTGDSAFSADRSACERAAVEMVARLPKLAMSPPPERPPRVDVTGMWEANGEEIALSLEAKVRSSGLVVPLGASVAATGRAKDGAQALAIVSRGLTDLGNALGSLFALYGADEAAWIRAIDAAEPDEQVLALSLLGRAKSRTAIPAMGKALRDPRERVAEAAADALMAVGDESAVPLLIGAIQRNDVRSEVRAIEAISKIGGQDARAYLEMTALGHENPEVRALSQDALSRMPAKGAKTNPKTY
jgi:hypothetical protein